MGFHVVSLLNLSLPSGLQRSNRKKNISSTDMKVGSYFALIKPSKKKKVFDWVYHCSFHKPAVWRPVCRCSWDEPHCWEVSFLIDKVCFVRLWQRENHQFQPLFPSCSSESGVWMRYRAQGMEGSDGGVGGWVGVATPGWEWSRSSWDGVQCRARHTEQNQDEGDNDCLVKRRWSDSPLWSWQLVTRSPWTVMIDVTPLARLAAASWEFIISIVGLFVKTFCSSDIIALNKHTHLISLPWGRHACLSAAVFAIITCHWRQRLCVSVWTNFFHKHRMHIYN